MCGASSTWSERCGRTKWLLWPPPRPFWFLPAPPLGGREQLCAAGFLLGSSSVQQRASVSSSGRRGATTRPTCMALL